MVALEDSDIYRILDVTTRVFTVALKMAPDRNGGYLCLTDRDGRVLLLVAFGEITRDKVAKYFTFAQEKAYRLSGKTGDHSSWQSRDEERNWWGGAVRGKNFIFSFSGLPEHLDEAMMLAVAEITRELTRGQAYQIAQISANEFHSGLQIALKHPGQ